MATGYIVEEKIQVSRGLIKDAEARNIFGINPSIGTSFIAAWENNIAYVYPNTALTMNLVSTSTSDTNVSFLISGLDSNYDRISETVTLNGTTAVQTTKQFFRINDLITVANNAIGDVTLTNNSTTYAKVIAGTGKNQASIFTVPAGYEFYLYRIDAFCATASLNNRTVAFRNYTRNAANVVLRVADTPFLEQMSIQRRIPFRYGEKTDIQFQLKGSAGEQEIGVFGEGILIKNPRQSALQG